MKKVLVVGAGFFRAVCARVLANSGHKHFDMHQAIRSALHNSYELIDQWR